MTDSDKLILNNEDFSTDQKITILLVKKNMKSIDITRKYGVHSTLISSVKSGRLKNKNVRKTIAEALDVPYEELWNERKNKLF